MDVDFDLLHSHPNFLDRPWDWRSRRACAISNNILRWKRWDDEATGLAIELLQYRAQQPLSTLGYHPMISAIELFEANGPLRWKLEAFVLARKSPAAVAAKLKIDPKIVTAYESLFFDLRTRLRYGTWIAELFNSGPMCGFAEGDLAGLWRSTGFYHGVYRLDRVIAATTGEGIENYSEDSLDDARFFVEWSRIPLFKQPAQVFRLNARMEAERAGLHPSAYHKMRRRKPGKAGTPKQSEMSAATASEFSNSPVGNQS